MKLHLAVFEDLEYEKLLNVAKSEGIDFRDIIYGDEQYINDLVEFLKPSKSSESESLTPREKEVLVLIRDGLTNREIAKKLFLSEKTVKNHLNNIFKKIEVSDRTNAALYAIKNGI